MIRYQNGFAIKTDSLSRLIRYQD